MTDATRTLIEKHPHLHWTEAAALVRLISLLDALQAEIAERFPACQHPELLAVVIQLFGQVIATTGKEK